MLLNNSLSIVYIVNTLLLTLVRCMCYKMEKVSHEWLKWWTMFKFIYRSSRRQTTKWFCRNFHSINVISTECTFDFAVWKIFLNFKKFTLYPHNDRNVSLMVYFMIWNKKKKATQNTINDDATSLSNRQLQCEQMCFLVPLMMN